MKPGYWLRQLSWEKILISTGRASLWSVHGHDWRRATKTLTIRGQSFRWRGLWQGLKRLKANFPSKTKINDNLQSRKISGFICHDIFAVKWDLYMNLQEKIKWAAIIIFSLVTTFSIVLIIIINRVLKTSRILRKTKVPRRDSWFIDYHDWRLLVLCCGVCLKNF